MTDENNKKLQYLKRGDVRTMEKDIARLREGEASKAREKIAQIKTEQEAQIEAQRLEQAKIAAEQRGRMEVEAKRKEKELIQSREQRTATEASEAAKAANDEISEREKLRAQFREAQLKEEEERKRFLKNVAQKAGEPLPDEPPVPIPPLLEPPAPPPAPITPLPPPVIQPAPIASTPPPTPPALPKAARFSFKFPKIQLPKVSLSVPKISIPNIPIPKVSVPKIEGYFPAKSSIWGKIWARIIISLFVLAILATLITFWYWYLAVREQAVAPIAAVETTTIQEPKITQALLGSGYYFPNTPRVIDTVILHSGFNTESNGDPYDMEDIIRSYKKSEVATHYLIGRNGDIFQLAPDYAIAYHAGSGKMPDGRIGVNNFSIGVSLVYRESETPNESQYQSLSWLAKKLQSQYSIPSDNILGYKDVAPGKITPWNFDWGKLKLLFSEARPSAPLGADFLLGQLFIVGIDGTSLTPQLEDFIKTVKPGGIILFGKNIETASQVKKLVRDMQKIALAETGLPLFIAIDQEGGVVSRLSFIQEQTGQPEIQNSQQAYETGFKRGGELKELGINLNLAPALDLTQPGDFLHQRSFQKSAEETGILAKSLIAGQKAAGILTAAKHFPGYGGISSNPEEKLTTLSSISEISAFKKAIEAKPELVMLASVIYQGLDSLKPVAFSEKGISFLKQQLGETPLVITDDLLQPALMDNFSLKEIVSEPIKSGADILLFSGWKQGALASLEEAVRNGAVPKELVDKSISRIVELKQTIH